MNYIDKSSNHTSKKDRFSGMQFLLQAIITAILTLPLVLFGQTGHEGHSMESHSWFHWVITIAIVGAIGWGIFKFIKRRKNQ